MTLRSVDHALEILQALQDQEDAGVSELAARLGVAPSTAHRVLTTLVERGFARRSEDSRRYRMGPAMEGMRPMDSHSDFIDLAHDVVAELAKSTGETVHLVTIRGNICMPFDAVVSSHEKHAPSRVGSPLPIHASSPGKALLASLSSGALNRRYPNNSLPVITSTTISTKERLLSELSSVRLHGYSRVVGEWLPGLSAVAMAVPGRGGFSSVAITVSGPQDRLRFDPSSARVPYEQMLVQRLRDATEIISSRLAT